MKFILAKKLGMTTIYSEGIARNVTLLQAGKNIVSQVRTPEKDGYTAVQVGLVDEKDDQGKSYMRKNEFRVGKTDEYPIESVLDVDQFAINDEVKVIGTSKGKGFQGPMKRHGFHGSPATHGHRHDHRAPGSIGCAFPERVFPGKRMAGRMGGSQVTMKNLKVALVDNDKKILAVEGAVPGNRGSIVQVIKCD